LSLSLVERFGPQERVRDVIQRAIEPCSSDLEATLGQPSLTSARDRCEMPPEEAPTALRENVSGAANPNAIRFDHIPIVLVPLEGRALERTLDTIDALAPRSDSLSAHAAQDIMPCPKRLRTIRILTEVSEVSDELDRLALHPAPDPSQ
jgi:hypothetical protein